MREKGKNRFIEYVRPVDLGNKPADVEVIVSKYCRTSEDNSSLYNHQETVASMPLTSLICKVRLEINQEDDIYELSAKDICIVTEFLKCPNAAKSIRGPSSNKRQIRSH